MSGLDLVVLTSGRIGVEVAARLMALPEAKSVTVFTSPIGQGRMTLKRKIRNLYQRHGLPGLLDSALARLGQPPRQQALAALVQERCPGAMHRHVQDFHDPVFLDELRALQPDLGVVASTYVLKPPVFDIPRLGSLNVHFGRAPEFRGSSPAFYEMLQGVPEVGVTIHRVTATLDGGNILAQRMIPLDIAPPGDPVAYLQHFQLDVLVPVGAALMAEAVQDVARGTVKEWAQDPSRARTYRHATYALKQQLRRVVAERRRQPG